MESHIVIAHGENEGTDWALFTGPHSRDNALTVAKDWSRRWHYVAVRPVGFLSDVTVDGEPATVVEWRGQ